MIEFVPPNLDMSQSIEKIFHHRQKTISMLMEKGSGESERLAITNAIIAQTCTKATKPTS